MNKIDYAFEINNRMKSLKLQTEFLNCQLCVLRQKGTKYCGAYNCISAIKNKTQNEYARLCRERLNIYNAISQIKDLRLKTLLEYRYVYLMTYEDIADLTNYSLRQVMRKMQAGMKEIEKINAV